tara:strand:- start:610 stop:1395 length:786 start_codon:yes stop_codon:yes gene_type:complete
MESSNHENIDNSNTQDIFLRNAVLSIIDMFNRKIEIDQNRSGDIEKHTVPFFYDMSGKQGFMQDFFVDVPDGCVYPDHAEGNYEQIPRGVIKLTGFKVVEGDITNPFVRGSFTQEERDINDRKVMKAYSSRLRTLPMQLSFDIKVLTDNLNKTFKITEKIFDMYHANIVTYFQYRGIRIPAQVKFPETITNDNKYKFTYKDDTYVETTFQVNMETYYPSFDQSSTMDKGNVIRQFGIDKKISGSGSVLSSTFIDKDAPIIE